jgi:hypothetical protein
MPTRSRGGSEHNGEGELLKELVDCLTGALRDVRPGSFIEDPKATEARLKYQALRLAMRGYDPEAPPAPPVSITLSTTRAARGDIVIFRGDLLDEQTIVSFGYGVARTTNFDPQGRMLAVVVPDDAQSGEIQVVGRQVEYSTKFEIIEHASLSTKPTESV